MKNFPLAEQPVKKAGYWGTGMGVAGESHRLIKQISPAGQEFPQEPQWRGSLVRSKQPSGQLVCAAEQVAMHAPFRQYFPAGQVTPQTPQLVLSTFVSTHLPLQASLSDGQTGTPVTGAGVRPAAAVVADGIAIVGVIDVIPDKVAGI
jgi:hypothetical protein